jgi:hypothetical protein
VSLHSPLALLEPMAHEPLDETGIAALAHGRTVRATCSGARAALLCEGEVVGIADRVAGDRWQPRVVLLPSAGQAPSGGAVA